MEELELKSVVFSKNIVTKKNGTAHSVPSRSKRE